MTDTPVTPQEDDGFDGDDWTEVFNSEGEGWEPVPEISPTPEP